MQVFDIPEFLKEKLDIKPVDMTNLPFESDGRFIYYNRFAKDDLRDGDILLIPVDPNSAIRVWMFLSNGTADSRLKEFSKNKDARKWIENGYDIICSPAIGYSYGLFTRKAGELKENESGTLTRKGSEYNRMVRNLDFAKGLPENMTINEIFSDYGLLEKFKNGAIHEFRSVSEKLNIKPVNLDNIGISKSALREFDIVKMRSGGVFIYINSEPYLVFTRAYLRRETETEGVFIRFTDYQSYTFLGTYNDDLTDNTGIPSNSEFDIIEIYSPVKWKFTVPINSSEFNQMFADSNLIRLIEIGEYVLKAKRK